MKKYLVLLILTVTVSVSLMSCDPFADYGAEDEPIVVVGFEYKYTTPYALLRLSKEEVNKVCKAFNVIDYPAYRQYDYNKMGGLSTKFRVGNLVKGAKLTIYCYRYQFTPTSDESYHDKLNYFRDNHKLHLLDSVVIVGPSPVYEYYTKEWSDTLYIKEVDGLCP